MVSTRGINLNLLAPRSRAAYDWEVQQRSFASGTLEVHFGDVASAAEQFICDSPMLVGCVAWVKSKRLVEALSQRPVALVVNKEFALRVDGHPERVPLLTLSGGVPSKGMPAPTPKEPTLTPVRCAGWAAKGRFGALMHHKFLVRLSAKGEPLAVWTGSFNLTAGAERNVENGMVISDPEVAAFFLAEFTRVWALSEPLLFTSGTPTPGSNANAELRVPKKRSPAKRKATARKKPAAKRATPKRAATTARKSAAPAKKTATRKKTAVKTLPAKTRTPRTSSA